MYDIDFQSFAKSYVARLKDALDSIPSNQLQVLAEALIMAWQRKSGVFICGNGGSAGNAIHLANDFLYGISRQFGHGLRVTALPANSAVITCLANDEGYDGIFSRQLAVLAEPGDIVIVLSGSGNSPNILRALEYCAGNGIETFAILGYSGGEAKTLASHVIHVPVNDMQISEDLQLVVGHLMMRWLYQRRESVEGGKRQLRHS
jgi:D-sedoheptulose 7-phosphate isomerase